MTPASERNEGEKELVRIVLTALIAPFIFPVSLIVLVGYALNQEIHWGRLGVVYACFFVFGVLHQKFDPEYYNRDDSGEELP